MRASLGDLGAPARLAAFGGALALIGGLATLAGAATGDGPSAADNGHQGEAMAMTEATPAEQDRVNGLASVAGGYTFAPAETTLPLGQTRAFRFRIVDGNGTAARQMDLDGGVRLHLIVVRRDFAGYQHVHPALQADGTWSVPLRLRAPGVYRAFADFEIDGKKIVLGHDLFVPGSFAPTPLPAPATRVSAQGHTVELASEDLHANRPTELHFRVSRNGSPVRSFDPYVRRRGHLIALRDGDLAYSHVHPEPAAARGEIVFHSELPSAGRYRLFLQFKVDGIVHTAPFTVGVQR